MAIVFIKENIRKYKGDFCFYFKNKRSFSVVKRPEQSLCIMMKKDKQDRDKIVDSISFLDDNDQTVTKEKKKRAVVKFMTEDSEIMDG